MNACYWIAGVAGMAVCGLVWCCISVSGRLHQEREESYYAWKALRDSRQPEEPKDYAMPKYPAPSESQSDE